MNRTLVRACVAISLLLLIGIFVLTGLLICLKATLSPDVRSIVDYAIGQLIILLGFAVHATFQAIARSAPENPTQLPPSAANPIGVKVP